MVKCFFKFGTVFMQVGERRMPESGMIYLETDASGEIEVVLPGGAGSEERIPRTTPERDLIFAAEADYSGYPDCRAAFVRSQQKTMRLALDWPVRIVTPFIHMSKADEWQLADRLGILDVIENETLTCYNGIPGKGCGRCPACKLRNRGYDEFLKRTRRI